MDNNPPPYDMTTAPYPPAGGQPLPSQGTSPPNTAYQPQTIVYANAPPGAYVYNQLPHQPSTFVAVNAPNATYRQPFFSRRYYGDRRVLYFVYAFIGLIAGIFIVIFLVIFSKAFI